MKGVQKIVEPLRVRFRDIDAMGHVNNAVFFTFFEEGRSAFLKGVLEIVHPAEYPFIMARTSCSYLYPLKLTDQPAVEVWIGEVGTKSFVFKYSIVERGGEEKTYARGESTMVMFDYSGNNTVPIPEDFLEKIEKYREGPRN